MPRSRSLSKTHLSELEWEGEATYRVLSYYFSVRWNSPRMGDFVQRVLAPFSVPPDPAEYPNPPTPGRPPSYSLVALGPRTASPYRLLYGDHEMLMGDDPADLFHHLLWHVNDETLRVTGDFVLIHAGAVVTPAGEGVLLPGDPGSGKTTLVAGLVRAGFGYLSDEAGAIDPISRRLFPYPRALALKERLLLDLFPELEAWSRQPEPVTGPWYVHATDIRPEPPAGPSEVGFVIAPSYRPGAATAVEAMTAAQTVVELGRNNMNLSIYRRRVFPLLGDIARRATAYRLVSGSLDEAVQLVAELTGAGPAGLDDQDRSTSTQRSWPPRGVAELRSAARSR